ncbi:MAG: endo alpha-1,4 polygalactosaminidase [Candidatus Saccharimonadales bacterium]
MIIRKLLILFAIVSIPAAAYFIYKQAGYQTQPKKFYTEQPIFNKATQASTEQPPALTPHPIWVPHVQTTWQWQLSTPVDISVDAEMYDIDLFTNDASIVQSLHHKGRHVVCYISAGSVEDWRPDVKSFPAQVIGKDYEGWPGEKWLDIRRIDVLGPIMERRLDQCQAKGFDSVEPDNINGFQQPSGFPLTAADQRTYNIWFADAAHNRNLSIGLKQDPDQANELVQHFDWALDEECFEYGGCDKLLPFLKAGKAVFNTEYGLHTNQFCQKANSLNFNAIRKHRQLDAFRETCR